MAAFNCKASHFLRIYQKNSNLDISNTFDCHYAFVGIKGTKECISVHLTIILLRVYPHCPTISFYNSLSFPLSHTQTRTFTSLILLHVLPISHPSPLLLLSTISFNPLTFLLAPSDFPAGLLWNIPVGKFRSMYPRARGPLDVRQKGVATCQ